MKGKQFGGRKGPRERWENRREEKVQQKGKKRSGVEKFDFGSMEESLKEEKTMTEKEENKIHKHSAERNGSSEIR